MKTSRKAVIFAGAKIEDYHFYEKYLDANSMIICCDSGVNHAKILGIEPDYILGDFDSANSEILEEYRQKGIEITAFPTRKDETDMQLGMWLAVEKGAVDVLIFGGIGDRFDHSLSNAHLLLWFLKRGIRARLINEKNCIELIDEKLVLQREWDYVSCIPLTMEVKGVTLKGFSYPLEGYDLKIDGELLGVSNEIVEDMAEISIEEGCLYVICARD